MKKAILGLAAAIILWCSMLATAYAPNIFDFSQKISISNTSTSSFPENGLVSIAFDDCLQSQYDYAWHLLKARGMTATFYVITDYIGKSGFMTVTEMEELQKGGCEIASHSKTHPYFLGLSDSQIIQECTVSKQVLQSYGFTVNNFAYPYGGTNDHINSIVSQYYRSGRNAYKEPYIMPLPTSQFGLTGFPGESGDSNNYAYLQSIVDQVVNSNGWTIIFFHDIVPDSTPIAKSQIRIGDFTNFLDYLATKGVKILTVNQALNIGSRDVAITSVVSSTLQAVAGTIVNINVTAKNEGTVTETFNVTTYHNNTKIETQTVTDLASGATKTLTFNWNTNALPLGNYMIKAEAGTVPNETDIVDNVYVDGTVRLVKSPAASFTYFPSNPRVNEPVLFDASSSTPDGGTITSYRWNFDDGNITSTRNPATTHVYTIPRTYNVTLTVIDSEGLNASAWNNIRLVKSPVARFTYVPSNPKINEPVLFDASSSTPDGGTITSYRWNFDDGNITSTRNPATTHVYTIPRTYNVTLTITDSEGLNASVWNSMMTSAPVQTEISIFTYSSSSFVGLKVEINGTLTGFEGKGISDANIVISYILPSVSEWVPFIYATTDLQGDYYSQWMPPSTGYFTLKAEWVGDETYAGASKNTTLSIIPYKDRYVFSVASNSTVSALAFNSTSLELRFNATGPSGTTGFAKVTITKTLVADITKPKIYLDAEQLQYSIASTADSWIVSFAYTHSTHRVTLALNPSTIQPDLRGDINNDGQVDTLDLSIVAVAFGSRPGDAEWNSKADLDSNDEVNIADIAIVAIEYGKTV